MALIKCPECDKTVSNQAVSCPNCGFDVKHRHWYSKKWGKYLILIIVLFTLYSSYKFYNNTKGLVSRIEVLTQNEFIKDSKLRKIQEDYNNLKFFEKIFVYNYKDLKKIPIELSGNDLKNYLKFNVSFSNYKYEEKKSIIGIKTYKEEADIQVDIKKNGKYRYDLVSFRLDMNNGYKNEDNEHILVNLDEHGNFTFKGKLINDGLLNNNITSSLNEPIFDIKNISLKEVTGYIYCD